MSALSDMAAALTDGALRDRLAIVRDDRRSLTPEEVETFLNEAIARIGDGTRAAHAHAAGYRKGVADACDHASAALDGALGDAVAAFRLSTLTRIAEVAETLA